VRITRYYTLVELLLLLRNIVYYVGCLIECFAAYDGPVIPIIYMNVDTNNSTNNNYYTIILPIINIRVIIINININACIFSVEVK
jgi:hypothetical protein